ncbi:MAG: hypothetical protein JST21_03310 [Bacteroidetes bacterium]|nr:hypothetical protein [Bacteroidota bacterium]
MHTENAPKQDLKVITDEFKTQFSKALSSNIDFDEFKNIFQHLKELKKKIVDIKKFTTA